ncbi:MAG: hypothetical protein R3B70_45330 [Polyangiaceae bacterium]
MQTRTKNALAALVLAAALGLAIFALTRGRPATSLRSPALDAVPQGAFVVAVADLDALRKTSIGPKLLSNGREIPGLGKVRDVCGIDPIEHVRELAFAIPAGGEEGDFGIVASGDLPDDDLLACASKVIEQRGGRPVIANVGSFRTVRDATMVLSGAEIAVKKGGPILFGAGAYLRAMIDAADGRIPSVRGSIAHSRLSEQIRGTTLRATVVLTPPQRKELAEGLADKRGPAGAASILAGALGATAGESVALHAIIACEDPAGCAEVATLLQKARDERAADMATRIAGFSKVLEGIQIRAEGETVQITAEIPADEAAVLVERVLLLRGMRHPMPRPTAEPAAETPSASASASAAEPPPDAGPPDAMAQPAPDEVVTPDGDAGSPPRDGGSGDAGKP